MNSMDREGGLLGLFRNKAVLACLTALCLACGGCASQPEDISPLDADGLIVLTIGTADTGGTMTPVGTAIAQVLSTDQLKFNISTSTGSFMNIQNLSSGEIDLGLVAGDSAYTAVYGTEDSAPTNEDLRAVAAVFSSTSNWMSPIRTGAFYVHDLKGMRIGAGPPGLRLRAGHLGCDQRPEAGWRWDCTGKLQPGGRYGPDPQRRPGRHPWLHPAPR